MPKSASSTFLVWLATLEGRSEANLLAALAARRCLEHTQERGAPEGGLGVHLAGCTWLIEGFSLEGSMLCFLPVAYSKSK